MYFDLSYVFVGHNDSVQWGLTVTKNAWVKEFLHQYCENRLSWIFGQHLRTQCTDHNKADLLKCTHSMVLSRTVWYSYRVILICNFIGGNKCKIAPAFDLIAIFSSARLVRVLSAQLQYLKSEFQSWALMCSWLQMVLSKFLSWHCIRVVFFYFDKSWNGKKLLQSHFEKNCHWLWENFSHWISPKMLLQNVWVKHCQR